MPSRMRTMLSITTKFPAILNFQKTYFIELAQDSSSDLHQNWLRSAVAEIKLLNVLRLNLVPANTFLYRNSATLA